MQSALLAANKRARVLAFYLPQYHVIPENNAWWGEGFTDWVNVKRALPRYYGHYQPHVPGELGYYNLDESRVLHAQAALAREFGVHGFCYYDYWFSGKRLLHSPIDALLADPSIDLPFCLCWANQTWSRTWSGLEHEILIRQEYSDEDHVKHMAWLSRVFKDPRYINVDGRPLFSIYQPQSIPDVSAVLAKWKVRCREEYGVNPFFCAVRTGFADGLETRYRDDGFDALIDFQPNRNCFPALRNPTGMLVSSLRRLFPKYIYDLLRRQPWLAERYLNTRVDYRAYVDRWIDSPYPSDSLIFPCVFPSWDNSARRTAATIIQNDSPQEYGRWLQAALDRVSLLPSESRIVFVNAWNEWAEGCHLEPDALYGRAFLEETKTQVLGTVDH